MTRHTIGIVSRLTGLKPDVIRAWERRYGAIEPLRTSTNRRYYTDEQVDRLRLLHQATRSGRQIGQIANLTTAELRDLVSSDRQALSQVPGGNRPQLRPETQQRLDQCIAATEEMDSTLLRHLLDKSSMEFSQPRIIDELVAPFLDRIGTSWETGEMRIAHEHMASAVIRSYLSGMLEINSPAGNAPKMIVGTPVHQLHEFGAMLSAIVAASEGWNVIYLGANLPAEELAAAAQRLAAKTICLSIVHPASDPQLSKEIIRLRHLLGEETRIFLGGRAASAYSRAADKTSSEIILDLPGLRAALRFLDDL